MVLRELYLMALVVQRDKVTSSESMRVQLMMCHTCHVRKGGLFTLDVYQRAQCADCARAAGKPIE